MQHKEIHILNPDRGYSPIQITGKIHFYHPFHYLQDTHTHTCTHTNAHAHTTEEQNPLGLDRLSYLAADAYAPTAVAARGV